MSLGKKGFEWLSGSNLRNLSASLKYLYINVSINEKLMLRNGSVKT